MYAIKTEDFKEVYREVSKYKLLKILHAFVKTLGFLYERLQKLSCRLCGYVYQSLRQKS